MFFGSNQLLNSPIALETFGELICVTMSSLLEGESLKALVGLWAVKLRLFSCKKIQKGKKEENVCHYSFLLLRRYTWSVVVLGEEIVLFSLF